MSFRDDRKLAPFVFDDKDNLIRIFRLPLLISSDFCFGGGIPTTFEMVDWFRPSDAMRDWKPDDVREFIRTKVYYRSDRNYLAMCRTGECFLIDPPIAKSPAYTRQEEKFIRNHYGKMPNKEIAARLTEMGTKRSTSGVLYKAKQMGLTRKDSTRRDWDKSEIEQLRKLAGTMLVREIAIIMGRSPGSIRKTANRYNIPLKREKDLAREHDNIAIWTAHELRRRGLQVKEIAKEMNLKLETIRYLLYGRKPEPVRMNPDARG